MSKPPTPRLPSKDDLSQLTHYSAILHLLHHRNHNQHRRSPWYRPFSLFRRNLNALLADYTTLTNTPTTNLERARLKAQTPDLLSRISQRLKFWQDVLVARWQRAFSQVVADGRFSVLGLVMLGVLGGVCKVVGIVDGLEAEGQAEIERVLEEFGREAWGDDGGFGEAVGRGGEDGGRAIVSADEGEPVAREADIGEVVAREDDDDVAASVERKKVNNDISHDEAKSDMRKQSLPADQSDDDNEPKVVRKQSSSPPAKVAKPKPTSTKKRIVESTSKPKPAKKKRKKGGDAIDDLFSGW